MQISSNYSMNGVSYENRRRQNDIPQFSTERAKQENESINPYMADTDFNEKAFDMIGPNAPQAVSYTHLDVYKRQVQNTSAQATSQTDKTAATKEVSEVDELSLIHICVLFWQIYTFYILLKWQMKRTIMKSS